ncbi:MAG: hypothetical protein HQL26_04810 [Candidatus Omnitrophica bacterium]|nr:hypothetical protein [Candidatus Omnitrophota bacterium]
MLKKLLTIGCAILLTGCSTASVPKYLQSKNPYVKRFYGNYDQTLDAVRSAMKETGWAIEKEVPPTIYEYSTSSEFGDKRQLLILSNVRATPYFVGTRYSRINVYIREGSADQTEVELRYLKVNSFPFKGFYRYGRKEFSQTFFDSIEKTLAGRRINNLDINQTLK